MNIHINKFVDRVRAFESRGMREFTMSMQEARDLHADITRLLLKLEAQVVPVQPVQPDQDIHIQAPGFR